MDRLKQAVKRPILHLLAAVGRRCGVWFDRPVRPRRPWRVLVIQFGGAGDVLRVFPLIDRIQAAQPGADIRLLTNQGADLLAFYSGPRPFLRVPFSLQWSYPRKLWVLASLRFAGIDLVVNPTRGDGMLECAMMAWLIGAPHRIGFDQDGSGFTHTHKQAFSGELSILEQNLRLLESLDIEPGEPCLRIRIPEPARAFAVAWYQERVPAGVLRIVIHPWASSHGEFRAWPASHYAELIERLLQARDAVVVVLGSESEAGPARGWLSHLPHTRVHDLAGATRLDEAAALIAGCDLFIGNDSGLLHFALAAGVPVVAVFGATAPGQVLHTSRRSTAVVSGHSCQPCHRHQPLFDYRCNYHFRCLRQLPVGTVLAEALRLTSVDRQPPG